MKIFSNIWNYFLILENEFQILENEFQILENTDFLSTLACHRDVYIYKT